MSLRHATEYITIGVIKRLVGKTLLLVNHFAHRSIRLKDSSLDRVVYQYGRADNVTFRVACCCTPIPRAARVRLSYVIEIVGTAINYPANIVGEIDATSTGLVAVFCADSYSKIAQPALIVLFLEVHIKHPGVVRRALACRTQISVHALTLIKLDVLDHIGRQIFQSQMRIPTEEILAVEQECIDMLPIDRDVAIVV